MLFLLILSIISNVICYNRCNTKETITDTIIKKDTLIKKDTIYYPKPIPKYIKIKDTIYIEKKGDSIPLPIEEKTYTDDSTYNVRISGFKPVLEEIMVFPNTIYITTEKTLEIKKKQRFNWGIQCGMGYGMINNKMDIFIGIGGQFNF